MAAQGRVGDDASGSGLKGPAKQGAAATFVNGQPALRVGDTGDHQEGGSWQATRGSSSVFIEGKPAHRQGDDTVHDGDGQLTRGSPNVDVGTGNGSAIDKPHDLSLVIEVRDATDRKIKGLHVETQCPHPAPDAGKGKTAPKGNGKGKPTTKDDDANLVAFDETTTISALCSAAPITIYKSLERGDWDPGAKSGGALPDPVPVDGDGVRWIHAPAPEARSSSS